MKYRVMAMMNFGIETYHGEYSGIVHDTKEAAEKELEEAKLKVADNATVEYCYIEEI